MKKNILKVAFVAAIAMVSAINVFNAQKSEMLSDVALANVEALADDEILNIKCNPLIKVTCFLLNGVPVEGEKH